MRRVSDVLVAVDGDERLRTNPEAWVHINEIPDGNWGAMGRVVRLSDIAAHVTGAGG